MSHQPKPDVKTAKEILEKVECYGEFMGDDQTMFQPHNAMSPLQGLTALEKMIESAEVVRGRLIPAPKGAIKEVEYAYKSGIEDAKKGILKVLGRENA